MSKNNTDGSVNILELAERFPMMFSNKLDLSQWCKSKPKRENYNGNDDEFIPELPSYKPELGYESRVQTKQDSYIEMLDVLRALVHEKEIRKIGLYHQKWIEMAIKRAEENLEVCNV